MPQARSTEVDPLGVINLIASNLLDKYPPGSILKELLQNADDAGAKKVIVGWTPGPFEKPKHQLLQGPGLFVANDGKFDKNDADAICRFGQNYKFGEKAVIGKFGLGLKSVFHLCEAFFYLSSTSCDSVENPGLFNNLASPWVKTDYDRGWKEVAEEDLAILRKFLWPICQRLGKDWFVLWLPLRRSQYCQTARFIGSYEGDKEECPTELRTAVKRGSLARTLPLLNSVEMFEFWELWTPSETKLTARGCLETAEIRSQFRACVQANADTCGPPRTGRYTTENEQKTTVNFSLAQSWTPKLLKLREDPNWPRSFVLGSGHQPDKAQPHAAVLIARRMNRITGGLDFTTAVFLPLDPSNQNDPGEKEFLLTLHGCFFVDSGRQMLLVEKDIRDEWNRRLMTEGVLPQVIPAIEAFASANEDPEALARLTRELERWISDDDRREYVCVKYGWIQRWATNGLRWERIDNSSPVVEIPAIGADEGLPNRAMPNLSDLCQELVITPTEQPKLTRRPPDNWPAEFVGHVLEIDDPESLYQDGGAGLNYYHMFVKSLGEIGDCGRKSLRTTVQKAFAKLGSRALRGPENACQDWMKALVNCLPSHTRIGIALGGNWPDEARRDVCGLASRILIVPDEFEPENSPGTGLLTIEEAIGVAERLAPHTSPGRNSNPCLAAVINSTNAEEVLLRTENLRLWKADRITAKGRESQVLSRADLQSFRAVFAGDLTKEVELLASVLAKTEVWIVPTEVARVVLPNAFKADVAGVLALIATCPPLADIGPGFIQLFDLLRSQRKDPNWQVALRYLLHRRRNLPLDEILLIGDQRKGLWGNLASAALKARGTPDQVIPTTELTRGLDPSLMDALNLATLDASGVAQLVKEVGPERISITLTSAERDEVLRSFEKHAELIRGLPLHDRADGGGMIRITANCYWLDNGQPGTLTPHLVLLKQCEDPVLAAIQLVAHPDKLTPVEVIRRAIQHGPADHWDTLLTALRYSGTISRELQATLRYKSWLSLSGGGKISPANVLYDTEFDDQIDAILRAIKRTPEDPVSRFELSAPVREHDGFRELARQLFPERKQLISQLASILQRDNLYSIGNLDLRSPDDRTDWIEVFREASPEIMPGSSLIGRLNAVDPNLCVEVLIPPLRNHRISPDRLGRILGFLRDRHKKGLGKQASLRIHNLYLRLATEDHSAFRSLLPELKFLNKTGDWAKPADLCIAEGLDLARTLDGEQEQILDGFVSRQPLLPESITNQPGNPKTTFHLTEQHYQDSVRRLRDYFSSWRAPEQIAGWAGAFLALLGNYKPLLDLANEFLGIGCPGHTVDYIRTQAGMREAQMILERMKQPESPSDLMAKSGIIFHVTDMSGLVKVLNLLGSEIAVAARTEFYTLFVGFGMDRVHCIHPDGWRVHALHLRTINPATLTRSRLREILGFTGNLVLRVLYGQKEVDVDFGRVLDEFSGDDDFGVRVAQESFLHWATYSLRFLGLNNTRNEQLIDLLRLSEKASDRRAEESAIDQGRSLPGRSGLSLESEVRDKLREMVCNDYGIQQELVAAIRRKVQEYRYEHRSVLFELFQNADDAYVESGNPPNISNVFVCRLFGDGLEIFHNGRPINRTVGDGDPKVDNYRHDLRKLLSLGHSDKGLAQTTSNVTGRFGLGFKSVFLLTDAPQIVSGRLAFEVLGGVYPLSIEQGAANSLRDRIEKAGLPKDKGTIFHLPARAQVGFKDATDPFARLAHYLVVFARRIRAVEIEKKRITWIGQPIISVGDISVEMGILQPISEGTKDPQRAIVIRCFPHGDFLLGLDENGFNAIPNSVPSVWVTAPTVECHDVGYLVNAPLDLDVGRSQVTWESENNTNRLKELSLAVCNALLSLFDSGPSVLGLLTDKYDFWRSLWEIVTRPGDRRELHKTFMWGESGLAISLYNKRPAIPTGLDVGEYHLLTSIPKIDYVLDGILDAEGGENLLGKVASWDGFKLKYQPGSVVSDRKVWSRIREWWPGSLPQSINLATIVGNEINFNSYVSPDLAASLGTVINRDLLRKMEHGPTSQRNEFLRLDQILRSEIRFLTQNGSWAIPKMILVPPNVTNPDRREEALRSAFAPPERVLANEFVGTGVDFFLACRSEMSCTIEEMAKWARNADTEIRRSAVLLYLREGEKHKLLQDELYRIGIDGTWLSKICIGDLRRVGFNDREEAATLVNLGVCSPNQIITPNYTVAPSPQLRVPETEFSRIAKWWARERVGQIKKYDRQVYPDGWLPNLMKDGPGNNHDARAEWLKFFVTCIVQTVGRVTPDQNREFVRLCASERWLATLADHLNGPREWLAAIERFIDRHSGEEIRYFYWLRHFVGVATVSRHLDAYADAFLSIDRFEGRFTPTDLISIRTSKQFQFGGPDAPTLSPILGIGANFALRELFRMNLVNRSDVRPFCYPAVTRLRRFLERLGWQDVKDSSPSERSRSIFEFISMHHPSDPTFGNTFDIPILMYIEEYPETIT